MKNKLTVFVVENLQRIRHWRYVAILGTANLASIIRMFIYAKLISLDEFGNYATLLLISSIFLIAGSLGFHTELQRTLPVLFRNKEVSKLLTSVCQTVLVVTGVFVLATICSVAVPMATSRISTTTLWIGLFGGFSQQLFAIITTETRSRMLLVKYSNEILIKNFLSLVAGVLVIFYSYNGTQLFLAESIVTLLVAVLLFKRLWPDIAGLGLKKTFFAAFHNLRQYRWAPVLSMLAIGILAFAMQNGERYLAKSYLNNELFAILSFGLIIPNMASAIQTILNSSIFVNQVIHHQEQGYAGVIKYSFKMTVMFVLFFLFASVPLYYVTRELIIHFYPKYQSVLAYLPVIYLAFAVRSSDFVSNIFIIVNKPHLVLWVQATYIAGLAVTTFILSRSYLDLSGLSYYFILNFANALIPMLALLGLALQYRKSRLEGVGDSGT